MDQQWQKFCEKEFLVSKTDSKKSVRPQLQSLQLEDRPCAKFAGLQSVELRSSVVFLTLFAKEVKTAFPIKHIGSKRFVDSSTLDFGGDFLSWFHGGH